MRAKYGISHTRLRYDFKVARLKLLFEFDIRIQIVNLRRYDDVPYDVASNL